MSVKDQCEKT